MKYPFLADLPSMTTNFGDTRNPRTYTGHKTLRKHDPFAHRRGNTARRLSRRRLARPIRTLTARVHAAIRRNQEHVAVVEKQLTREFVIRQGEYQLKLIEYHKWQAFQAEENRKRAEELAKRRAQAQPKRKLLASLSKYSSIDAVSRELAERMCDKLELEGAKTPLFQIDFLPHDSHCIQRFSDLCSRFGEHSYSLVWHGTGVKNVRDITAEGLQMGGSNGVAIRNGRGMSSAFHVPVTSVLA
jgi:hypothetical protein